jgi:hypothetical protein
VLGSSSAVLARGALEPGALLWRFFVALATESRELTELKLKAFNQNVVNIKPAWASLLPSNSHHRLEGAKLGTCRVRGRSH